jgi:alpha-ketoglutarate-dependent sulfate ester dioxygenase
MTSSDIAIRRVAGRAGAEISGVRLSGDLDPQTVGRIRDALLVHKVVFFRSQDHLDDDTQQGFASLLGDPVGHPTVPRAGDNLYIGELDSARGVRANAWHTDVTFVANYPAFSILRALEVPPYGGETVWANTVAAYEDLTPPLQLLADQLWAVHTNTYDYAAKSGSAEEDDVSEKFRREVFAATEFETEHPLVRVHPETQERSLVLGSFARSIVGVSGADSALLQQLFQSHIIRIENTVRWRWTRGDVAIWDNRATQHYASADYEDLPRKMRRITVAGSPPVSVDGRSSVILKGAESSWYEDDRITAGV